MAVLQNSEAIKDTAIGIAGNTATAKDLVEKYEKKLGKIFQVGYRAVDDKVAKERLGASWRLFGNHIPLFAGVSLIFQYCFREFKLIYQLKCHSYHFGNVQIHKIENQLIFRSQI